MVLLVACVWACREPASPFEEVSGADLGGPVPCYDAAVADFDADGRLDIYAGNHGFGAVLLRNLGGFRFENVIGAVGIDPFGDQHGAGWGDADGDGSPDLYVSLGANLGQSLKANRLYRNAGDRFEETSSRAGASDPAGRGRGVTWIDYDRDGRLDVFVANFRSPNVLLHNEGGGTFIDRAPQAGLARSGAVYAVWTDYDGDGWPDVLLGAAPDGMHLMRNQRDGTFTDVTVAAGLPRRPRTPGAAFADADGDGDLDLVVASGEAYPVGMVLRDGIVSFTELPSGPAAAIRFETDAPDPLVTLIERDVPVARDDPALALRDEGGGAWTLRWHGRYGLSGRIAKVRSAELVGTKPWRSGRRPHRFYENRGDGTFAASRALEGLGTPGNGAAVVWGDVDNDGDLDLFVAQSGIEGADEPDALYLNDGGGRFVAARSIPALENRGAGAHLADFDGDGRLDLLLLTGWGTMLSRGHHRLLRNVAPAAHWLELELRGVQSNRPGFGAWVDVVADGRRQFRYHTDGALYAQDLLPVHFGLGAATRARVTIRWPSGVVDVFDADADRRMLVVEGSAAR
jgi:hypothetical protein